MLFDLLNGDSFAWIDHKNFFNKIFDFFWNSWNGSVCSRNNFLIKFGSFRFHKRKRTTNHRIQDNSTAPNINKLRIIRHFPLNHLWRGIAWRSTRRIKPLPWMNRSITFGISARQSKVNNFDLIIIINHDVFWFKIAMRNSHSMKILNPINELMENMAGLLLRNSSFDRILLFLLYDITEKLAILHVLSYQQETLFSFNYFVKVNQVAMPRWT